MKLKELPKSLARMISLLKTPSENLGKDAKTMQPEVIISLTSIPYRLSKLHIVIRSLLNQSVGFKKIILWLNEELENQIPRGLAKLKSNRFEIRFCKGTSSHRKLVETLKLYPDDFIVTCDDDVMYPDDWLESLLLEHKKNPESVVAHMCRVFKYEGSELSAYHLWPSSVPGGSCNKTLAIGCGGVLYPPNSLHEDVLNEELYMKLAPKADDLWFKAMSYKQGTAVVKVSQLSSLPTPIMFTQKYSLKKENINKDANKAQWMNIAEYYGINVL